MKKNQQFLIPMIISMVLLPCFLLYFLNSEYVKEKEAIRLEGKELSFNRFFATLDTLSVKSTGEDRFPEVYLQKNRATGELKYEFKIDSVKKRLGVDSLINSNGPVTVDFFELSDDNDDDKLAGGLLTSDKASRFRILQQDSNLEKPIWELSKKEISATDIVKRMVPQICFSLFLLLSVFLSFWFIARSLRNERQLTLIRNDFMSNMSHELKTPVSTIGVALEALSTFDAADNPELRKEYIEISRNEVERLGLLVDKALNISLYEQGKFIFDLQAIDLKNEMEKILRTLKVQLDNKNVKLDFTTKGTDFNVLVDRTHMVNVVYNLIENAIKYSPEDPEVKICLSEANGNLDLSIEDNGLGIGPEFQDKVFDKFFRVPKGNTHNVKGHGLGLSYVKEVVESMGGRISLKSGLGLGSSFHLKIPKTND